MPTSVAYPLSFGQKELWAIYQNAPESAAYLNSLPLQFNQKVDAQRLRQALQRLIAHHFILQIRFNEQGGQPGMQLAHLQPEDYWTVVDARGWDDAKLMHQVRQASQRPLVLQASVFRATLFQGADTGDLLLLTLHHIISDASTLAILGRQLVAAYQVLQAGEQPNLPAIAQDYNDYIRWERAQLDGRKGARMAAYWAGQLAGDTPVLQLPTDKPRPPVQGYHGASESMHLSAGLTRQLDHLAKQHQTSLTNVLLSAWQIVLHRYSRQAEVWIGIPTSAVREQADFADTPGYLVNLMVVRASFDPTRPDTLSQLIQQNARQLLAGLYHQPYPFSRLMDQLHIQRDPGYPPLVQNLFSMERADLLPAQFSAGDILAKRRELAQMEGQLDLSITWSEEPQQNRLHGILAYNTDLFEQNTIQRMLGHIETLLVGIVNAPDSQPNQLPILTEADKAQLQAWNQNAADHPPDQTVADLFEQQVEQTPDKIALVFEQDQLTYAELNQRANQLAHTLIEQGVQADTLVGLCVERSLEMIIGLLGILKAGGVYVPLDPSYPADRLRFMLQDSQVRLLLTQSQLKHDLPLAGLEPTPQVLCLYQSDLYQAKPATNPAINPAQRSQADDLAYVIYTSGSTGKPKGVMVNHMAAAGHIQAMVGDYRITPADKVLQFASMGFDVAIEQVFCAWLGGATLCLLPDNRIAPEQLMHYLAAHQVTVADIPPAYWQQICHTESAHPAGPTTLRLLILGGETLPLSLAQTTRQRFPDLVCINAYGPTEATITASAYPLPDPGALETLRSVPIGRATRGKRIYILDEDHQPVPPGIPGELCIAGNGLARGYLNRPGLTAEKFIEVELFSQIERIYKTGDLARWLSDGNLEYLGRIDHQVKLRGFRIEPGEIESLLGQHPGIGSAAVVLHEREGNPSLAAYLTLKQNQLTLREQTYRLLTTAQRAEWVEAIERLHIPAWPDFFQGDAVMVQYWRPLYSAFADYQIGLYEDTTQQLAAAANAIPLFWSGEAEDIPEGWDAALALGFAQKNQATPPNTLCVLTAVVNPDYRDQGLSQAMLWVMKAVAHRAGFSRVLIPVRPTQKEQHPHQDFIAYCQQRTPEGWSVDPWLRVHERLGGAIVAYSQHSQLIRGSVHEWETWTGQKFPQSGQYQVAGAMQPVWIDLEQDQGRYDDLSVWVRHSVEPYQDLDFHPIHSASLKAALAQSLPDYMIPASFNVLDAMPLTPNGKVDRKALEKQAAQRQLAADTTYIAPRNATEMQLAQIWADVLDVKQVGVKDHFFDLGGHSLLATRVISKISAACGVEMPLKMLFQYPVLDAFAGQMAQAQGSSGYIPFKPPAPADNAALPMAMNEIDFWFMEQMHPNIKMFYLPAIYRLKGHLNTDWLRQSLHHLVRQYSVLRTGFTRGIRAWFSQTVQRNHIRRIVRDQIELPFEIIDLRALPAQEREPAAREQYARYCDKPLPFPKGPLWRCVLWRISDAEYWFLFLTHHIISDGWSLGLTMRKITAYYRTLKRGLPLTLDTALPGYPAFAAWQWDYFTDPALNAPQREYWCQTLKDLPPPLVMPGQSGFPFHLIGKQAGGRLAIKMPLALVDQLQKLSRQNQSSLYATLLAAFKMLLFAYTQRDDLIVCSPFANHTQAEFEHEIGLFMQTLPIRTCLHGDPSGNELIKRVMQNSLGVNAQQQTPPVLIGEWLQKSEGKTERQIRQTLDQMVFSLINTPPIDLTLSDRISVEALSLNKKRDAAMHIVGFDLFLSMEEHQNGISGDLIYRKKALHPALAAQLWTNYQIVLQRLADTPDAPISKLIQGLDLKLAKTNFLMT